MSVILLLAMLHHITPLRNATLMEPPDWILCGIDHNAVSQKEPRGKNNTHTRRYACFALRDDFLVSRCSFAFFKCVLLHGLIFSVTTGVYYLGRFLFCYQGRRRRKASTNKFPGKGSQRCWKRLRGRFFMAGAGDIFKARML